MDAEGGPGRDVPAGGGETGAIARGLDWASTRLGPPAAWPPQLRALVGDCLAAPVAAALCWGPGDALIYNDRAIPLLGSRHPAAFGAPADTFPAVALESGVDAPSLRAAVAAGRGFAREAVRLDPAQGGGPEPWDVAATPVRDGAGAVAGLWITATARAAAPEADPPAGMLGAWSWAVAEARISADAAFARAHGVAPALAAPGVEADAFLAAIHPDDVPGLAAAAAESLRSGEPFERAYRLAAGGGGGRSILLRGRPERGADGRATLLAGIGLERGPGGAQAGPSDGLARQILDGAVDYAIVATDLSGRVTRWNRGAARLLGWSEREMIGRTLERMFTAEDLAADRPGREMDEARAGGGDADERWYVRKGGGRVWAHGRMMPLQDDAGGPAGFVKLLRDETAQKRQGQRVQLLARASAGLLGAERPDDVLNAVLDAAAELVDFDESHSYGLTQDNRHLRLLHSSGTRAGTFEALQSAPFDSVLCGIVAETRRPLVLRDIQRSTEPRHAPGRAAGLQAFAGYPIRVRDKLFGVLSFGSFRRVAFDGESLSFFRTLALYVSITHERADRAAALRALNATLEQQVEARTTELMSAEAALRQSQKMEAVGQLTGGLAHDFNNLLTGIAGSLELIGMRLAQDRTRGLERYIEAALGASRRAASLTHRLLAFSRRQTLDPSPTDVNRLVAGMAELVRRTMGPQIAVALVPAEGLWTTLVDASQLENALLNLCINARDAMPDGGRLVIETGNHVLDEREARDRDLPHGEYVTLCVADDGTGMSPEVAARAFDPFFTTKPIGQGTGLGLSMIYGFARQSGGQVRIDSEVGRGTTVCVYLPRHHGTAEPEAAPAALPPASRAAHDETVLVVDDEPTVRMLVVEVLEELGYVALQAEDAAAGLAVLRSEARVDLLVTDVGLPGGINGRQMADAGRAVRPSLKVLFITGYAESSVLSHGCLEPGMQVMTKPFAMGDLGARIRDLIAGG